MASRYVGKCWPAAVVSWVLLACGVASLPSVSFAVLDPQPNSIGVYFDTNANTNHIMVDVPAGESILVYAYIIVTNPTFESFFACTFGYRNSIPEGMESSITVFLGAGPGMLWPYHGYNTGPFVGWVGAGYDNPAVSQATVVGYWRIRLLAEMEIEFYITSAPEGGAPAGDEYYWNTYPTPHIATTGDPVEVIALNISSGSSMLPVAAINTDHQPVATEGTSWGAVKALFRDATR